MAIRTLYLQYGFTDVIFKYLPHLRIRDESILALDSLRASKVEQACIDGALQKYKNESSNYLSLCYHFVDQNCYHNNYQLGDVLRDLPLGSR